MIFFVTEFYKSIFQSKLSDFCMAYICTLQSVIEINSNNNNSNTKQQQQ